MATSARSRELHSLTVSRSGPSHAPSPRMAVNSSSRTGSKTTPARPPSRSSIATLTTQAGNP